MKKIFYALAVLSLLLAFSACDCAGGNTEGSSQATGGKVTEAPTEKPTEITSEALTEKVTEKASEETSELVSEEAVYEYTDISASSSPVIVNNNTNSAKASSMQSDVSFNPSITFDGNASFTLSHVNITSASMHETTDCPECGIKETDLGMMYYICNNTSHQGGFLIELENPIPTKLISGMTITFSTTMDIVSGSQIRILPSSTASNSAFVNECSAMGGAVGQLITADLGMTADDITAIADSDGMVRKFKLYFRDKDNTDIYIKSIDFVISLENLDFKSLCAVSSIEGNCFYRGEAIAAVAEKIAESFLNIGLKADINLKTTGYTQNTPQTAGKISYTATITLEDGTEKTVKNLSTTIPAIKNAWLERADDSPYGALTDAKEQWKTRFDRAGLIYLVDNEFDGIESLKALEYAVISADKDVTDASIIWFTPQILNIDGNTFSLYANAFLDYGGFVTGEDYRFVVRAVTSSDNYVLHLDIPFTYEPLDCELENSLRELSWSLQGLIYTFDDGEGIADKLNEKVTSELTDSNVIVTIEERTMGMTQATFDIKLSYAGDIHTDRFPHRPSDSLYNYYGEYFTIESTARFNLTDSSISLTAPVDGARDVVIASATIVNHMNADLSYLISAAYPFDKTEACPPEAITFEWLKGEAEAYTLIISESIDMSDPITYTVNKAEDGLYVRVDVNNLKAGTTYYWQVKAGDDVSNMACFTTASYPRFIFTENVSNFRDLGGYTTLDGYRVKQGLAYRSANLDTVNAEDIKTITEILGINTDLDLRGQSSYSPLGKDINIIRSSVQWYTGVFAEDQYEAFRFAIAQFANEDNYPMVYHCQIGRDRTGTVTTTILALLGVDEEMLIREYMLSFNSVSGNGDNVPGYQMVGNIKSFINGLKNYGPADATLAEHAEAFLLEVGVTPAEIQAIKDILLEK